MGKVALRHVLKNFLNHFETLESRRRFNQDDDLYQQEFQSLKELTETLKRDEDFLCGQGLEDVNRKKNRYKDILPCKSRLTKPPNPILYF
jgi:protein tyrosine phosphatase